jgi:hypothetical protein
MGGINMIKITIEYHDKEYSTTKSETIKDKILIFEIGPYAEKLLKECKLEMKKLKHQHKGEINNE